MTSGEFAAAASLITQLEAVTEATGSSMAPFSSLVLAAWQGRETEVKGLAYRLGGCFCLAVNQHAGDQVLGHAGQPGKSNR